MKPHAPLLPCLLGLAAGIWVQGFAIGIWWTAPVVFAGLALTLWRLKASPLKKLQLARYNAGRWGAALLFCAIGALDAWVMLPGHPETPVDKTLTGAVEKVTDTAYGQSILVRVDGYTGAKALLYYGSEERLETGYRIAWPNALSDINDPENLILPGMRRFLASQGVMWIQPVGDTDIAHIASGEKRFFCSIRDSLSRRLEESSLSIPAAAFLQALLLGDRQLLAPEERQTFADSGVAHVLALSGLHMGMLAALLTLLFLPLNAFGAWKWRYPLVVTILWLYAVLTGFSAPAVRACIMATFLSAAIIMERRNSAFNALCAAGIVILSAEPAALGEPGFQLSIVCVASLILFGGFFMRGRGLRRKALAATGASLVATAGSWALSAWWFGSFPIAFLPANLLLLPFLPFYIGAGGIYLISLCMGADPVWLANLLEWVHSGALWLCSLLSGFLPPLNITLHWLVPVLWLGAIGCLAWFIHSSRRKRWGAVTIGLAVCAFIGLTLPTQAENTTEGLVIRNQSGRIVLTDFHNGEETKIQLPPEIHSAVCLRGLHIIGADRRELPAHQIECDVLILASGWKGSVTPLLKRVKPKLLVVHPSVFSFLLDDIRSEANKAGVPIHDLRTDGPLDLITFLPLPGRV